MLKKEIKFNTRTIGSQNYTKIKNFDGLISSVEQ
jgi:hypothetical protein